MPKWVFETLAGYKFQDLTETFKIPQNSCLTRNVNEKTNPTALIAAVGVALTNKKDMTHSIDLPPDLQGTINAARQAQRQNPNAESFVVSHVKGVGWRLISCKTGKSYSQDAYYEEFGYYPDLPHPEVFYSDEAIAERAKRKRPKPRGFGANQ